MGCVNWGVGKAVRNATVQSMVGGAWLRSGRDKVTERAEVKELRGRAIRRVIYMDSKVTRNDDRSNIREGDSEWDLQYPRITGSDLGGL